MKNLRLSLVKMFTLLTSIGGMWAGTALANTTPAYWNVWGDKYALPVSGQVITVPAGTIAVDLRGLSDDGSSWQLMTAEASPNCLYYVDDACTVEGLPDVNVVRNGYAESLIVTDEADYFCPEAFTAEVALFKMTPRRDIPDKPIYSWPYYDTLVLPFAPDDVMPEGVNGTMPAGWLDVAVFQSLDTTTGRLQFEQADANALQAYMPYLVTFSYGLYGTRVHFIGENKRIEATMPIEFAGEACFFIGVTFALAPVPQAYCYYRSSKPYFYLSNSFTTLEPFRCLIINGEEATTGGDPDGDSTDNPGIANGGAMPSILYYDVFQVENTDIREHAANDNGHSQRVYALTGQRRPCLQRGFNVVDGQILLNK
jgi:hypothetical protein